MSLSYPRILRNSDGFYFRTLISLSKGILNTIDLVLDDTPIENNNKEESRVGVLHEDVALANLNCFQKFWVIKAPSDMWICLQANQFTLRRLNFVLGASPPPTYSYRACNYAPERQYLPLNAWKCTMLQIALTLPTRILHFLPFFFLMLPLSVLAGLSTKIASSSLLTLLVCDLAGVESPSDSISFRNSFLMESLRFSHHSLSDSVCAWISSRRFRKTVFAAISFADWKIDCPQLLERAFAWDS